MVNYEEKDVRTGKAPKHQEAAKKKGKSNWVDWRTRDIQSLEKIARGYNPFQIEVNGKWYELKEIALYDKKGVVIKTSGWFGSNNNLETFPVPETLRRLKPKFDGETFIMPKKKEYYETNKSNPHAILFIPIDYFDFEIREEDQRWGSGQHLKVRVYESKRLNQDTAGNPVRLEEWIGEPYYTSKGMKLLAEIDRLEDQIAAKKEELDKL